MDSTQIVFLLLPKMHLQDVAGPAQVFFEASELGKHSFRVKFATTGQSVCSAQGLGLSTGVHIHDLSLRPGDLVCIPGFDFASFQAGMLDAAINAYRDWVWEQKRKGVFVASICSGAMALGQMGLLDHVECTSHWKCIPFMKTYFPKCKVLDNRLYVFDKGIFTSAGMTSGIDMSLALVERWRNPLLAAKVAQEMVINVRRNETTEQKNIFLDFKNHFNADVYKAQEMLSNHLEASFTLSDLARRMNLSVRHLSRLFKDHTGETIQVYREKVRIEHGEQLLLHTEMSVKEIAVQCGFGNPRQFSRIWLKAKGKTPGQFRKEI